MTPAAAVFDPDSWRAADPISELAELRRGGKPVWVDLAGTPGFWLVTRHADVQRLSRDDDKLSSRSGNTLIPVPGSEGSAMLPSLDPPWHRRVRALISKGFTPRRVAKLEAKMRMHAREIVDAFIEQGSCDFVLSVSAEMSLQVLADIMGIPNEDRLQIFAWSNAIGSLGVEDPEYAETPDALAEAGMQMFGYCQTLLDRRRALAPEQRPDDILSALLAVEIDGEQLNDSQLGELFLLLAVAGNETTRNTLSHILLALTAFPEARERLLDGAPLGPAIEESLRWATPVLHFRRTAKQDFELGGVRIETGQWVVLHYFAANRDETVFPEPERFDVTRATNPHVAFGGGGSHFCLGAQLARMELTAMLEELLRRVPDIAADGEPDRLRSAFFHGVKHLPAVFTPGQRSAA